MTRRPRPAPPAAADDPFVVLGLPPTATAADVAAARRRLAKSMHPDIGGDADRMRRVNEAANTVLRRLRDAAATTSAAATRPSPPTPPAPSPVADDGTWVGRYVNDTASFTIEALPAEAFEALLVVTTWIGELLVDDPPYALETVLSEPASCWCRLDLVPDAGATTVGLTLASIDRSPVPHIDLVRDTWVAELNRLDWDDQEGSVRRPPS